MTPKDFEWHTIAWPASKLAEAIDILAHKSKLASDLVSVSASSLYLGRAEDKIFDHWFTRAAQQLKITAESVAVSYLDMDTLVRGGGPILLRLPPHFDTDESYFLALLKSRWGKAAIIGPDLKVHHIKTKTLQQALSYEIEAPLMSHTETLLTQLGVSEQRRKRALTSMAQETILREGLGSAQIITGWLLNPEANVSLWQQARFERAFYPFFVAVGAFAIAYTLTLLSWVIIGQGDFNGHLDSGWLQAWALLTFNAVFFKMIVFDYHSKFSMNAGGLIRRKMLYGTLKLQPDDIRHQGAGQFLGRVLESESLQGVVLNASVSIVTALVMILFNSVILALGAGGLWHTAILLGWLSVTVFVSWRYFQVGQEWIEVYRNMTNDLVERMVGHRTRLVQEEPEQWHVEEDKILAYYLELSVKLDRIGVLLESFIDRGWMIVSLIGIAVPFITGSASPEKLTLSVGGILFVFQALHILHGNIKTLLEAILAWDQVKPLLETSTRAVDSQELIEAAGLELEDDETSILLARDIVFSYGEYRAPVLHQCSVQINKGERILLEGPSGGGKSTLAAVMAGLYPFKAGLLLLGGLDQHAWGAATWRQEILMVPQFQENHVFTETLAFNLLMGVRWPPWPEDLAEAEAICRELGLGDLIDQMPAGFEQRIGDGGWRLSHGEQSRLYIARALLQKPSLLILDESFGALDPENLQAAMESVLKRSSTLMVIAHP